MTLLIGRYGPNAGVKATSTTDEGPRSHLIGLRDSCRDGRVNYNDLTATSLEFMVNKGNHSQMALIQVSEIL